MKIFISGESTSHVNGGGRFCATCFTETTTRNNIDKILSIIFAILSNTLKL